MWVEHPMCAAKDDWNVRGGVDLGHGGGNDLKEEKSGAIWSFTKCKHWDEYIGIIVYSLPFPSNLGR